LLALVAPWRLDEDDPRFRSAPRPAVVGLVAIVLVVLPLCGVVFVGGEEEIIEDRGRIGIDEMVAGSCLNEVNEKPIIGKAMLVDCVEPHEVEVVGVTTIGDRAAFPGESAVQDEASRKCGTAFESYAPAFLDDPAIEVFVLYPDAMGWNHGDRGGVCLAGDPARKRTGSLR
jgi:hypothetical protein